MENHHIFFYYNKRSNNYMCEDVLKEKETQCSCYDLRVAQSLVIWVVFCGPLFLFSYSSNYEFLLTLVYH
jgi:hypothetical protein